MTIIGEYDREGYIIMDATTRNLLFIEGNSPGGGLEILSPWNRYALPLNTIRTKCKAKAKEIAALMGVAFGGIERVDTSMDL